MYNPSEISTIIKLTAQNRKITVKKMLEDCKINKGFIYDLEHKSSYPSCDKIYRIADYFDCSVDFLLGKTNNSNIKAVANFNGNNSGLQTTVNTGNVTINSKSEETALSEMETELLKSFSELSFQDKIKFISEIKDKNKR